MKKVRVEIGAILEVYVDADVTDEEAERIATEIALEQTKRLDECESGIRDENLWLASYVAEVRDCEEVDCE